MTVITYLYILYINNMRTDTDIHNNPTPPPLGGRSRGGEGARAADKETAPSLPSSAPTQMSPERLAKEKDIPN